MQRAMYRIFLVSNGVLDFHLSSVGDSTQAAGFLCRGW
jgi:hypothetical protein